MEDFNGSTEGVARKRSPLSQLSYGMNSRNSSEQPQVPVSPLPETQSNFTKWTDEKHSMYLSSMETSFVNDLYDSLDTLGWNPQAQCPSQNTKSRQHHPGTPTPSGQFKVFQDGSWTRIDVRADRSRPRQTCDSSSILSSPWIQHYRSSRKGSTVSITSQEGVSFTGSAHKFSSSCVQMDHQDILESNAEVSDQNFVDEDSEEEKPDRKRKTMKCRKISKANDMEYDQVVPFNKLSLVGDLTQGHESFAE